MELGRSKLGIISAKGGWVTAEASSETVEESFYPSRKGRKARPEEILTPTLILWDEIGTKLKEKKKNLQKILFPTAS